MRVCFAVKSDGAESVFVLSVLIVLDVLLFLPQEMMLRLKNVDRKRNKIFFIFSSIPKVKYYWLGEPNIYHDSGVFFTRNWGDCGVVLTVKN